ncbi:SDR family NAD(P)-dependent oxidoreductase [Nesterenkonia alba]|uniref:SDR family NAD(P)-dependent oxidoreductase n=1 Tax=Nesterenkonia alba TaxID=515814 RepID=UPI0003B50AC8|nr:SDR family NAD(P)-dependent oxidoreductase [Nesterenkonia alba]
MEYKGTTALVTGASSGIGAEFARRLGEMGADVVIVARRADALESVAEDIRATTGSQVHIVSLDLSAERAGYVLATQLAEAGIVIDTVINCAGVGVTRSFSNSTEGEIRRQLNVNLHATVDVSHAFLPQLVESGRGALVNVASLTAYMPVPGMAVYAASKAFVVRLTEALAHEVRATSVTVLAVSPGPTATEFYSISGTSERGVRFQTPAEVVSTTLRALEQNSPPSSIISGRFNRWIRRLAGVLPTSTVLRLMETRPAPS